MAPEPSTNTPALRRSRRRRRKLILAVVLGVGLWVLWGPMGVSRSRVLNSESLNLQGIGGIYRSYSPHRSERRRALALGEPGPEEYTWRVTFGGLGWMSMAFEGYESAAVDPAATGREADFGSERPISSEVAPRREWIERRSRLVDNIVLAITLALTGGLVAGWIMVLRRWLFTHWKRGHCTSCGYQILAGQDVCPECGALSPCQEVGVADPIR